jgi:hypothetical protein
MSSRVGLQMCRNSLALPFTLEYLKREKSVKKYTFTHTYKYTQKLRVKVKVKGIIYIFIHFYYIHSYTLREIRSLCVTCSLLELKFIISKMLNIYRHYIVIMYRSIKTTI